MKIKLFIIATLLFSSSCLHNKPEATENKKTMSSMTQKNTDFTFNLFRNVGEADNNLFFSPYSINSALTMTYIGSENNTQKEMKNVMMLEMDKKDLNKSYKNMVKHLDSIQSGDGVKLLCSNTLWPQKDYKFKKKYIKTIKNYYGADIKLTDFTAPLDATKIINKWVEDSTENMIVDLIAPGIITPTTRMVLTNAVYFKGDWKYPFPEGNTKEAIFHTGKGKDIMAPIMNQTRKFSYTENKKLQALELPYAGNKMSMVFILPKNKDDFTKLEESLNSKNIGLCLSKMLMKKVQVSIPKFKVSSGFNLSETLIRMGMKDAFSMEADFSGMDGTHQLYLTAVLHKAFVDVNEQGTEAAAASAAVVGLKSIGGKTPYFNANHPFIFLIKENINHTILFMGKIIDPTI